MTTPTSLIGPDQRLSRQQDDDNEIKTELVEGKEDSIEMSNRN